MYHTCYFIDWYSATKPSVSQLRTYITVETQWLVTVDNSFLIELVFLTQEQSLTEVIIPCILMVLLGLIHSQTVLTHLKPPVRDNKRYWCCKGAVSHSSIHDRFTLATIGEPNPLQILKFLDKKWKVNRMSMFNQDCSMNSSLKWQNKGTSADEWFTVYSNFTDFIAYCRGVGIWYNWVQSFCVTSVSRLSQGWLFSYLSVCLSVQPEQVTFMFHGTLLVGNEPLRVRYLTFVRKFEEVSSYNICTGPSVQWLYVWTLTPQSLVVWGLQYLFHVQSMKNKSQDLLLDWKIVHVYDISTLLEKSSLQLWNVCL